MSVVSVMLVRFGHLIMSFVIFRWYATGHIATRLESALSSAEITICLVRRFTRIMEFVFA